MVVRGKKGKGVSERIEDIIKTPAFDRIREKKPQVINKIVAFEGDITLDGLGMSEKDLEIFYNKVNIIFHSAASIKFNDPIKIAVQNNVLPTKKLLAMGHKIKQLDVIEKMNFFFILSKNIFFHRHLFTSRPLTRIHINQRLMKSHIHHNMIQMLLLNCHRHCLRSCWIRFGDEREKKMNFIFNR